MIQWQHEESTLRGCSQPFRGSNGLFADVDERRSNDSANRVVRLGAQSALSQD